MLGFVLALVAAAAPEAAKAPTLAAAATGTTPVARGRAFVEANCASCHAVGATGESPVSPAPAFRTLSQRYPVRHLEEAFAEGIIRTVPTAVLVLDQELRVRSANERFSQTFGVAREELEGGRIYDLLGGEWNIPALRERRSDVPILAHPLPKRFADANAQDLRGFPGRPPRRGPTGCCRWRWAPRRRARSSGPRRRTAAPLCPEQGRRGSERPRGAAAAWARSSPRAARGPGRRPGGFSFSCGGFLC